MEIALALSGGGVRATVFHLGILLRLADENRLDDISKISTVSGGSLAIGLIFSHSNLIWPSSENFKKSILPRIATILTTSSLAFSTAKEILNFPWRQSRGNKFANAMEKVWGINGTLKTLSKKPEWFINTTSINTGKNWRFTQNHMGDWVFGHNYDQNINVSTAIAASAAIPYLVGKIEIPISPDGWYQIDPATDKKTKAITPQSDSVFLWDGGVYENLGVEPLYKPQRNIIGNFDFLLVADASARLTSDFHNPTGVLKKTFPFLRPPRLFDITTDQIRSLRSRMIMQAIIENGLKACILRLGNSVVKIDDDIHKSFPKTPKRSSGYDLYLSEATVSGIARMETHANKLSNDVFNNLLRHGYETADTTLTGYQSDIFPESFKFDFQE